VMPSAESRQLEFGHVEIRNRRDHVTLSWIANSERSRLPLLHPRIIK